MEKHRAKVNLNTIQASTWLPFFYALGDSCIVKYEMYSTVSLDCLLFQIKNNRPRSVLI